MSKHAFSLFHGTVIKADPVSFLVEIAATECEGMRPIIKGVTVSNGFSRLFGYKDSALPEPGSTVLCVKIDPATCYILGTVVRADVKFTGSPFRTVHKATDGVYDAAHTAGSSNASKYYIHNNNRPSDVVEGERVISNDFGIMLELMQQFAALKASELSQVQVHALDDLVRIISHNFEHFTAMGGSKVVQDGKYLHAEYGATHLPSESMGQPTGGNPTFMNTPLSGGKLTTPDDENDVVDFTTQDGENTVAIDRIKLFMGTLGDLINLFIVAPRDGVVHKTDGTVPTQDDTGLLQLRATTDGALHIRSTKEIFLEKTNWIRVPVRKREFEDPDGTDGNTVVIPSKQVYQFNQEYVKGGIPFLYALQALDYAAYTNEQEGYANFNAYEKDVYTPPDRATAQKLSSLTQVDPTTPTKLIAARAGVYLLPNGGVMLKEANGAAIVMEGGNISIQAANDLHLQPMRHLVSIAGGTTSIQSATSLEVVSNKINISGYTGVNVYADKNDIALHSNNDIVLKAGKGVYQLADNLVLNATTALDVKAAQVFASATSAIYVTTTGNAANIVFASNGSTMVTANSSLIMTAGSSLVAAGSRATNVGTVDQVIGISPLGAVKGTIPNTSPGDVLADTANLIGTDVQSTFPRFSNNTDIVDFKFVYENSAITDVFIPQTIAQQEGKKFERTESPVVFPFATVNDTLPFPGENNLAPYVMNSKALVNLEKDGEELYNKTKDLDITPTITLNSLSSYKFYNLQ